MGRAAAVLRREVATPRVAAAAVLVVALAAYYAWHEEVVDLSKWWDIAILALCLILLALRSRLERLRRELDAAYLSLDEQS